MSTLISVRTEENTVQKLDQLAESMDRNRNWLINEAIRNFLELHEWRRSQVRQGIADSDAGRSVSTTELRNRIAKRHAAKKK